MLFADISGFTQLTEQLTQRGPEGAEELTLLLNRYFGTIIDTLEQTGGDVLKFAGDALLAVWPVAPQASLADAVMRITDVARVLQATLHDYEVAPGIRLSMKLAIGAGDLEIEHLGGVFDRWEFLVSGKPLAQLGRANDAAEPGQIVLAKEAAEMLDARFRTSQAATGVFRLDGAVHDEALPETERRSGELSDEQTERLLTFLPAAIRQRVAAGYADWLSELRQVSVVFMNLPGFGVDTELGLAQAAMRTMQTALYRYEGSINKMSVDDKGVSLIAVLGLPPLSHTDDPERAARAAKAGELLNLVGLAKDTAKYPAMLSGGERQRVAIARAIVNQPDIIIADEPTTALDVTVQAQILALIDDLRRARGLSVIFITHDFSVVSQLCDRVAVMYAGELVELGTTEQIIGQPLHPYTSKLMQCVPQLGTGKRRLHAIPGLPPRADEPLTGCAFASRCHLASEACTAGPIALEDAGNDRTVRCIHQGEDQVPAQGEAAA